MKGGTLRACAMRAAVLAVVVLALLAPRGLRAQPIDMSHGGPITVTARDGMDWRQNDQEVVARGDAVAVRGNVTVTADVLIAHYRKKAQPGQAAAGQPSAGQSSASQAANGAAASGALGAAGAKPPAPNSPASPTDDTSGNEIYRLEAIGHVHIFTPTDNAWGDKAVYDMDKAVLILTGHALKLVTPQDVITARDSMEYYSQTRISIARGNAVVVTNDGRRIAADTLVAYSAPPDQTAQNGGQNGGAGGVQKASASGGNTGAGNAPPANNAPPQDDIAAQSGKLKRVEGYGNVDIRTATETIYGDRGVYLPDIGKARVIGHVRVTRGDNQVEGVAADIDMKTGVSTMLSSTDERVKGLIVPAQSNNAANGAGGKAGNGKPANGNPANGKTGNTTTAGKTAAPSPSQAESQAPSPPQRGAGATP
jgi:lipopolysaccharide export system protein LptA